MTETFQWNPMGTQSHPAKRVRSRNRVLRVPRVTAGVKRTQGACRPRDGASKASLRGSRRRRNRRKAALSCREDRARRSHRGLRAGHVRSGVPQEPGSSFCLRRQVRRYRHATQRSGSGRAGGSRSTLMVPVKRGNSSHEEPVEGSGVPRVRNCGRERWRRPRALRKSQRNSSR